MMWEKLNAVEGLAWNFDGMREGGFGGMVKRQLPGEGRDEYTLFGFRCNNIRRMVRGGKEIQVVG